MDGGPEAFKDYIENEVAPQLPGYVTPNGQQATPDTHISRHLVTLTPHAQPERTQPFVNNFHHIDFFSLFLTHNNVMGSKPTTSPGLEERGGVSV